MSSPSKTCNKCGEVKPVAAFYKARTCADGLRGECKKCSGIATALNVAKRGEEPEWVISRRAKQRAALVGNPKKENRTNSQEVERHRREREANPEVYAARQAVKNAIRNGTLSRRPCEKCGDKAQAHHDDYSKPLDVRWLCTKHHSEHHVTVRENRERQ